MEYRDVKYYRGIMIHGGYKVHHIYVYIQSTYTHIYTYIFKICIYVWDNRMRVRKKSRYSNYFPDLG